MVTNKEKKYSDDDLLALEETAQYVYSNRLTAWITNLGHKACESLRTNKNDRLIDLGCGGGDHVPFVKSSYLGLDVDVGALNKAAKEYTHCEFKQASIYHLPLADDSSHSILAFGVLEHLDDLDAALSEIERVLHRDGEFIFAIPTEGFLYRLGRFFTTQRHMKRKGVDYDALLAKEHVNTCQKIICALEKRFKVASCRGVPFYFSNIALNFCLVGQCKKK